MATYLFDNSKNLVDADSSGDKYGFDDVKNRLLFNNQGGVYGIDEYKNLIPVNIKVGDIKTLDGIDVLIIATLKDGTWISDIGAKGTQYIAVDKNHDLSYYFTGNDYVDEVESSSVINTANKYGYEWGGYNTETGIQDTAIGTGLNNTNQLISKNLQPYHSGWWVVWDKVMDFRSTYGHNWFVPSRDELSLVYENKANLTNLSTISGYSYYWSSSEFSSKFAWGQRFDFETQYTPNKTAHIIRFRLCRML